MANTKVYRFCTVNGCEDLRWMNKPKKYSTGVSNDAGIEIFMDILRPSITKRQRAFIILWHADEYRHGYIFNLSAKQQFDQAGLMVYKDTETWIKAGLEAVDGKFGLSVVVTNNYSDWSTQIHSSGELGIRIDRFGDSFAVEAKSTSFGDWDFIRICHLNIDKTESINAGHIACAPTEEGGSVVFDSLSFKHCDQYHHESN